LKLADMGYGIITDEVAPYTGAWIETISKAHRVPKVHVAPYTGAWIETTYQCRVQSNL